MPGRPRLTEEQVQERKERIKQKNARYYERNKTKWNEYNSNKSESFYTSQICRLASHLNPDTQAKVKQVFQN